MSELRLGTRGSALALTQARFVAEAIGGAELVEITTSGDRGGSGDKSRWVDEIERALLEERIDLAVHSAKDVPGVLAEGLEIAGSPPRADPRDGLIGAASLAALEPGARVGTSSLRRWAQLRALRPDLEPVELRGNVDTRLRRLEQGDFDAIVLARAGLARLGRDTGAPLDGLVPAPGQGTLAIEARTGDRRVAEAIAPLRDADAEAELAAERTVVRRLGAGCETPLGVHAQRRGGSAMELRAFVGRSDGSAWLRDELRGENPVALGEELAERLLSAGAEELLA